MPSFPSWRPRRKRGCLRLRLWREDAVFGCEAQAEGVHERVQVVAILEDNFAADRRDAHAVAVARDPRDAAGEKHAVLSGGERSEAERVHERDRTRAHRKDVADDAANASRGALKGLDKDGWLCDSTLKTAARRGQYRRRRRSRPALEERAARE